MTEEQKQVITEFRQYVAAQGVDISHLTDEQVAAEVARNIARVLTNADKVREALKRIMKVISKAEKDRQRCLYYCKKKTQQRKRRKRKLVRK